ncbi:hypothetical protein FPQ10_08255 [Allobacillus sp. SKP2-8]|uniref:hypothetical protein n=1 Tax=unclassified Allobacillus TaxID=2628859 RepID=UPI001183CD6C|nr:hypothetical protein [Allobacillus sp. SKP2-8]TSJ66124.1 hypothetical protein FPQ10_08255 [Allobacillus sp. SKP2-8]
MSTILKIIEITLLAIFTIALFLDFFPQPNLPDWSSQVFWFALILLIIAGFLSKKVDTDESSNNFGRFLFFYTISLIIIFSIAGGESQAGISLTEPYIWIVIVLGFFIDNRGVKKHKN